MRISDWSSDVCSSDLYEQNGLQSNRSNYTGTRSRVHRFGEAFRGEMANTQSASLFGSWQLRDEYDASLVYHKFWRVDGNKPVGSNGINAVENNRSEEHTSELQSLMRISYAVFCLKKHTRNLPMASHYTSTYLT